MPQVAEENRQVEAISPVSFEGLAELEGALLHVRGTMSAKVTYQCSRCLELFETELSNRLDERFSFSETGALDEDIHLVEGDEVELSPYVEEAVNLALEYRPLCSETCQGLCPSCGSNLNHETCDCSQKRSVDPRLAALEGLLSQEDSQ